MPLYTGLGMNAGDLPIDDADFFGLQAGFCSRPYHDYLRRAVILALAVISRDSCQGASSL